LNIVLVERLSQHGALAPAAPGEAWRSREVELPPTATAPRQARRVARQACVDWSVPHDVAEDVSVVVSELVTNAVLHAGTPLVLALEHEGTTVAVAVGDGQSSTPWLADQAAKQRSGGRGILLVSRLGADWGVVRTVLGKTVWVNLDLPSFARESGSASNDADPDRG
jgi:anti-sigma regulatory factor (Ser/Thr protein kinase)